MAESSLAIVWQEHCSRVGSYMGWGRGVNYADPPWSVQQQFEIDGIVASGLRNFYFPAPLDGDSSVYEFSFLKPTATVVLPNGASTIPLPDDFGGFEGDLTIATTPNTVWFPIKLTNEGSVRVKYSALPTATGRPIMAALQPLKGTTYTQGQRWQLIIWPLADQNYTLAFQYWILPDYLGVPFPFAYGGAQHSETILESCLAVAESRLDDTSSVHQMAFKQRLAASIGQDRKNKPQSYGYNGDRSDCHGHRRNWRDFQGGRYTYNGVAY